MQLRKKRSTDRLVQHMAAETISKGMRRMASNGSRRSLKSGSISSASLPTTSSVVPLSPRAPLSLRLSNLQLRDLPNVIMNHPNCLYAVWEVDGWGFRGDTQKDAGSQAVWPGTLVHLPVSGSTLRVYVYHECEVLADKLIGCMEVSMSSLMDSDDGGRHSGVLYDSSHKLRRKARGEMQFDYCPSSAAPDRANVDLLSPRVNKNKVLDDSSDIRSAETEFVDIAQLQVSSGKETSKLAQASNILKQFENPQRVKGIGMVEVEEAVTARSKLSNLTDEPPVLIIKPTPTVTQRRKSNAADLPKRKSSVSSRNSALPIPPVPVPAQTSALPAMPVLPPPPVLTVEKKSFLEEVVQNHAADYVFDHAFYLSFRELAAVHMRLEEFVILAEALGISAPCMSNGAQVMVNVPPGHASVFASAVTSILHDHFGAPDLPVSEDQAGAGVQQLIKLLGGSYINIRGMLFLACKADCRPSKLSRKWIQRLLATMGRTDAPDYTAADLLQQPLQALGDRLGIRSSVLLARLGLYRRCLAILDIYWQRGIRPNDRLRVDKLASKGNSRDIGVEDLINASDLDDKEEMVSPAVPSSSQASQGGTMVSIAPAQALFDALLPLNRAYGWGLTLIDLTTIANSCGDGGGHCMPKDKSMECEQETCWVEMQFKSFDKQRRFKDSLPDHLIGSDSESPAIVRDIHHKIFVKIPRTCCTSRKTKHVKQSLLLQPEEICVGISVRILPAIYLQRVCVAVVESWWERPSASQLAAMAGEVASVVSIAELASRGLVGVRLRDKLSICDALPMEALLRYQGNAECRMEEDPSKHPIKKLLMLKQRRNKKSKRTRKSLDGGDIDTEEVGEANDQPAAAVELFLHSGGSSAAPQQLQAVVEEKKKDLKHARKVVDRAAAVPALVPQTGDHGVPPPPVPAAPSSGGGNQVPEQIKSCRPKSAPSARSSVRRGHNASEVAPAPDTTWIKPPTRLSLDLDIPVNSSSPSVSPGERKGSSAEPAAKGAQAALHLWQPTFDDSIAEYTLGVSTYPVHDYPPVQLPPQDGEVCLVSPQPLHERPHSAAAHRGRPASAKPKTVNHKSENIAKYQMDENVDNMADAAFGVIGAAYIAGGGLAPFIALPDQPPPAHAAKKTKPRKVYKNFFDAQEKAQSGTNREVEGWALDGAAVPLAASPNRRSQSPGARRKKEVPQAVAAVVDPNAPHFADEPLVLSDEEEEPITTTKKKVKKALNRPKTAQEQVYFDRETARSAKEAAFKENYLMKELKRLGVNKVTV